MRAAQSWEGSQAHLHLALDYSHCSGVAASATWCHSIQEGSAIAICRNPTDDQTLIWLLLIMYYNHYLVDSSEIWATAH